MEGHDFRTYDDKILFNVVYLTAGEVVESHDHDYPHDLFITRGTVRVKIESIVKDLEAPSTVHFPNGAVHGWSAVTDAIVVTTHPIDKVLA